MVQDNPIEIYHERVETVGRQKQYRTMALLAFCVAVGLTVARLIIYYLPIDFKGLDDYTNELIADAIFTVMMQVGVLVILPLCFYVFILKKKPREILAFSNYRKTKWYNCALAVPIGLCCLIVTIGVSGVWYGILTMFGYTYSASDMPATFSPWMLIVELVLTGVMPAICEEFFNRGGMLTTLRGSFPLMTTVLLMAVEFGLFHQNIMQVFYTMLFGGLMAFLTLRFKSVYPAMIIHFINNSVSVVNSYCYEYGFLGGGISGLIEKMQSHPRLVLLMFAMAAGALVGLVALLLYLNSTRRLAKKKEVILDSGFDHTHNRVVLLGEEDQDKVRELGLDKEVYGRKLPEDLYKPTLRDNVFYIGAIVVCVLTTVFTFVFGLIRP